MILRMVIRARSGEAIWPRGVSETSTKTFPWLEWERTLGWAVGGLTRTVRKARQSSIRRKPTATKRTPLGARATSNSVGTLSTSNGNMMRSDATLVESPTKVVMLPLGIMRIDVWSFDWVKEACDAVAASWIVQTLIAKSKPMRFAVVGSSKRATSLAGVVPLI